MTTRPALIRSLQNPAWLGLAALLLVLFGLNRPGVTIDEPLDVAPGRHYWDVLAKRGTGFFSAAGVQDAFGGNPDHPPLARWLIGAASLLFQTVQIMTTGQADPTGLYILAGRVAPALAFSLTVWLIGRYVRRESGPFAGQCAALAYLSLPHVFAHAHLAALETVLNLAWCLALLAWLGWLKTPGPKSSILAAICTGLALLTKIQGWLILPWALLLILLQNRKLQARLQTLVALPLAPLVWFLGWPWLWYNSAERIKAYFGGSVQRLHLNVLYFGTVYADNMLPWHYALVQFLAAITPIVLLLFILSLRSGFREQMRGPQMALFILTFYLIVLFSTGITRYDHDRLFLVIWPGVAILAGSGSLELLQRLNRWGLSERIGKLIILCGLGSALWPCLQASPLSYVSPLSGGLKSFESIGMDLNYWGDAADTRLIAQAMPHLSQGTVTAVVPTLHANQAVFLTPTSMARTGAVFRDQSAWMEADMLIVYRREAYWPEGLAEWLKSHEPLALRKRGGVWLAGIWPGPRRVKSVSPAPAR